MKYCTPNESSHKLIRQIIDLKSLVWSKNIFGMGYFQIHYPMR